MDFAPAHKLPPRRHPQPGLPTITWRRSRAKVLYRVSSVALVHDHQTGPEDHEDEHREVHEAAPRTPVEFDSLRRPQEVVGVEEGQERHDLRAERAEQVEQALD